MADGPDSSARAEFDRVYAPLLRAWLRPHFLRPADADDLTRDVLAAVGAVLREFRPTSPAAFRSWLRATLGTCLKAHGRPPVGGVDAALAGLAAEVDADHDRHVVGEVLAGLRPHFPPATWQAFWRTVILAEPPARVAADLGLTPAAVFIARARVLNRLRQEVAGLVDEV